MTSQEPRGHNATDMAETPQFTAGQIMEAARRAEAEGKLDFALQFYRHIIEYHGSDLEAYEARDSFQRVLALQRAARTQGRRAESNSVARLPLVVQPRPRASLVDMPSEPEFAFKERYRAGTLMAQAANWAGWLLVGVGSALGAAGAIGMPAALAAPSLFELPAGVVLGIVAVGGGLALVFLSQLALAVFDNANASRHLLAIERAKAEL